MTKKILAGVLSAAMVASVFAACGSPATPETTAAPETEASETEAAESDAQETEAPAASSDTTLSIMWWGGDARNEATEKVCNMYTDKTGVGFTVEYTGWDGFWSKLPVLAASHKMTDVLQMDAAYIHQYVDNGALVDLSQYIDLTEFLTDEEIEFYTINGGVYGLPLSRNGQGLLYDATRLEELGIEEPKANWTWDELVDWAYAAKDKCPDGVYPMYDARGNYTTYQEYSQSYGNPKVLDGTTFNFNEENFKQFCDLFQKMVDDGVCPPAEISMANVENDPVNDNFLNGKVLLRSCSVGSVSNIAALNGEGEGHTLGYVALPEGNGGAGWCQSTIFFAISADSKNPQAAADFLKYFVTDEEAGAVLGTVRGLPLSDAVYDALAGDLDAAGLTTKAFYDVIAGAKAVPYWDDVPTAFADFKTEFQQTLEAHMLGQEDTDSAYEYLKGVGEDLAADAQ